MLGEVDSGPVKSCGKSLNPLQRWRCELGVRLLERHNEEVRCGSDSCYGERSDACWAIDSAALMCTMRKSV